MKLTAGIVGLPNVGKSTLFNALLRSRKAATAPYPFCTIDPNLGTVPVPDANLEELAKLARSKQAHPATLEIVDIAGLVRGAHRGEGLGNQFLSHIREVDALVHVVRLFADPQVPHAMQGLDPLQDIEILETELLLADLQYLERRLEKLAKTVSAGGKNRALLFEQELCKRLQEHLNRGVLAWEFPCSEEERPFMATLGLLTAKPQVYCCNVSEEELARGAAFEETLRPLASRRKALVVVLCAKLEEELPSLEPGEAQAYLEGLGRSFSGIQDLLRSLYQTLGLQTFYTANQREARAWPFLSGTTAWEAAGMIHSDFQRGFIACECIAWKELRAIGSLARARELGRIRLEGREYRVQDGDVLYFRFHV